MAGSPAAQAPTIAAQVDAESFAAALQKWIVAASVMLGAFLAVLDSSIVNLALRYVRKLRCERG
jgi:hypothetical protein